MSLSWLVGRMPIFRAARVRSSSSVCAHDDRPFCSGSCPSRATVERYVVTVIRDIGVEQAYTFVGMVWSTRSFFKKTLLAYLFCKALKLRIVKQSIDGPQIKMRKFFPAGPEVHESKH